MIRRTSQYWFAAIGLAILAVVLALGAVDERTRLLLGTTIGLAAGSCALALPAGTLAAVLIHRTDVTGRRWWWSILVAFLFVPLYLQAAGWDGWLGRQGWLWEGASSRGWRMAAAIWIHAVAAVPWVAVIVGAGLQQVPPELEELALLDMSPLAVLVRVTLRMSRGAILAAGWWVATLAAGEITATDLYQVRTFAEELYTMLPLAEAGGGGSAGITLPRGTEIVAGGVILALLVVSCAARHDVPSTPRVRLPLVLGRWNLPLTLLLAGIVAATAGVPLASLCRDAGGEVVPSAAGAVARIWSWNKLAAVVLQSPWHFRAELMWTLAIAGTSAVVAMAVAIPLAWLARTPSLRALPALVVTSALSATPGPVVALAMIAGLNREDHEVLLWLYDRTILAPVIAATARALPVAIVISWWSFRTIPSELVDMCRLDGCGMLGQLRHLAIPLRRELLLVGCFVALAVAMSDLGATLLVAPPGIRTLSMRVFGLLHAGVDDQVAAVCLFNAMLHLGLAVLASFCFRWGRRWDEEYDGGPPRPAPAPLRRQ